jgi:uncharacterized protein (TIGR00251 family)
MIPFHENSGGILFQIKVLPRSSRCGAAGRHGDALKIKIIAPPVEGKANEEVIRFLSRCLRVKTAQIAIVSGEHSRIKTVAVMGITGQQFRDCLNLEES